MLQADSEVLLEVVEGRGVDFSLVASLLTTFQLLRMRIFLLYLLLYDWSEVGF